jgi:hypothetical protein
MIDWCIAMGHLQWHWGRGNRSNCNSNGAGATGALGQRCSHCHCDRSIVWLYVGPWGRGARAWAFYSMFFIPKRFVNAQMEVRLKEWRTCLTTLTTVYSGWFGLSLVNALTQLRNCMFICNDEPCLEANLQVIPAGFCDDGYIDCIQ